MPVRIGECVLDIDRGTFHRAGEFVPLRPKTFDLLAHFVRNPERLITKDELLDTVWPDTTVTEDSLTQCVRDLRKAIGDGRQEVVRTVARRGYLFQPPKDSLVAEAAATPFRSAEPLVAVLPFRLASASPADASVLDGVVEEVINALACFRTVAVFARHSAFELAKSRGDELPAFVARFGIDYLVEGVVEEDGDGLRASVTLSEAATNRRVWAHAFSFAADAALTLPAAIARHIVTALASSIESAAMRRTATVPTSMSRRGTVSSKRSASIRPRALPAPVWPSPRPSSAAMAPPHRLCWNVLATSPLKRSRSLRTRRAAIASSVSYCSIAVNSTRPSATIRGHLRSIPTTPTR